jgi:hypothetical protein
VRGRIDYDGHRFHSEGELKRYLGLRELVKSGRLTHFEVHPVIPLVVNQIHVAEYIPTFRFTDQAHHVERCVQVLSRPATPVLHLKMALFEALFALPVERWGDG